MDRTFRRRKWPSRAISASLLTIFTCRTKTVLRGIAIHARTADCARSWWTTERICACVGVHARTTDCARSWWTTERIRGCVGIDSLPIACSCCWWTTERIRGCIGIACGLGWHNPNRHWRNCQNDNCPDSYQLLWSHGKRLHLFEQLLVPNSSLFVQHLSNDPSFSSHVRRGT